MHIYFTMSVLPVISTKYKVIYMLILSLYKKRSENTGFLRKEKIVHLIVTRQLLFHLDSRKLHRLNTFLGHEPLGKCFDLCTITMH